MKDLECPYCEHQFDFDGESPRQDEKLEIECPECEKRFIAYASYSLYFSEYQANCLNGEEHIWEDLQSYPFVFENKVEQRCEMCDESRKRDATQAEIEDPKLNWDLIRNANPTKPNQNESER